MRSSGFFRNSAVYAALLILLGACGGGGGGGGRTTSPPTTSAPTTSWQSGVFYASSNYEARCRNPRSGFDIEGNAYTDRQGTLADELNWLRSWTHETYLWNDEVTDQNPDNFFSTTTYFDTLKTNAVTASGSDKDNFHFYQSTEDYLAARNAAPQAGYGAGLSIRSSTPPRDVRVAYTEPNSPASTPVGGQIPLPRGTRILEVDGVDLINADSDADVATLNGGMFPDTAGETHTFLIEDVGGGQRQVTLTSANITPSPVNHTAILDRGAEKVGYILFNTVNTYASEKAIANAFTEMANAGVSDLVLDLRYNGGGLLAIASQTSYMIAGPGPTSNANFETLRFNGDAGNFNPVTGARNDPMPFYDTGLGFSLASGTPLSTLNLNRVFILSTGNTCSASESIINGLRGVDVEVILIGDITCGKPYGFYPTDNCGTTWYSIQFQGVNDKGFGDYADGFVPEDNSYAFGARAPGCTVEDDFTKALGDPDEALLAAALTYRDTGACPVQPVTSSTAIASTPRSVSTQLRLEARSNSEATLRDRAQDYVNGRDLRMPY